MNNCERFKDLILTDYIDQELDSQGKLELENHLKICSHCRDFLQEVKNETIPALEPIDRPPVPERIWTAIKERIEAQEQSSPYSVGFWQRLRESCSFPQLAPVIGAMALFTIFLVGNFYNQENKQARAKAQVEYLAYVLEPEMTTLDSDLDSDEEDTQNEIENYFL